MSLYLEKILKPDYLNLILGYVLPINIIPILIKLQFTFNKTILKTHLDNCLCDIYLVNLEDVTSYELFWITKYKITIRGSLHLNDTYDKNLVSINLRQPCINSITIMNCSNNMLKLILDGFINVKILKLIYVNYFNEDLFDKIIEKYPNLEELQIPFSFNPKTDKIFHKMASQLLNLKKFTWNNNSSMQFLVKCHNLRVLHFNEITDINLLHNFPKLEYIRFNNNENIIIDIENIKLIINICSNLKRLFISHNVNLITFDAKRFLHNLQNIKIINEIYNKYPETYDNNITDNSFIALINKYSNMRILNLCECKKITQKSIDIIINKCKRLEIIILVGCAKLNLKIIIKLINSCKSIKEVDIRFPCYLPKTIIKTILYSSPNLQLLKTMYYGNIYKNTYKINNIKYDEYEKKMFDNLPNYYILIDKITGIEYESYNFYTTMYDKNV